MTNSHIDQLTEWWENAEEGVIEKGDTVINRSESETTVYVATVRARRQHPSARILARTPKPKPAWHNAVAVMADDGDGDRMVWTLVNTSPPTWESADGFIRGSADLNDVTPLIEAKVTDDAVARVSDVLRAHYGTHDNGYTAAEVIAAALGIEAE